MRRIDEDKRKLAAGALMKLSLNNQINECDKSNADNEPVSSSTCTGGNPCEVYIQTDMTMADITVLESECQNLRSDNIMMKSKLESSTLLNETSFMNSADKVRCLTGLSSFSVVMAIFNIPKPCLSEISSLPPFY